MESLAIIGIGCRFPGNASTPDEFWNLLVNGVDAITEVPKDRWDNRQFYSQDKNKPGKLYAKEAGFIKDDVFKFDPAFFGISPREAMQLDPQQRLLLETTWEAIEDAGLNANELTKGKTGVFIGGFCLDNKIIRVSGVNREIIDSQTSLGASMTMLANKISYVFDFKGPSVTMDTACSSSLSAIHFATNSLRNKDCEIAIVGGVNVMLIPEYTITMAKGGFLSDHTRCKTFDKDAKGYVRAEGAGIVILKPLSKAIADKDTIYAVVKETGANQDGRTAGISLPNADMQKELLKEVYTRAGVPFGEVQYIEAHGTGTQAGDKAETDAIQEVFSVGRNPENKITVGSVKTNIGHMEAGAGIAGVIKAALCLKHKQIPPNLHFNHPNPEIKFEEMCIHVPAKLESWPSYGKKAYAGVNSFGYGGANVHILLEEAPVTNSVPTENSENSTLKILPISAPNKNALPEIAKNYAEHITQHPNLNSIDLLYTTTQRRTHHTHRSAILFSSKDDLLLSLQDYASGKINPNIVSGRSIGTQNQKIVFVCTGMGPQWWAMGRELYEKEPVYRKAIQKCERVFHSLSGWSLEKELLADKETSRMSRPEIAQAANFFIQYALYELLKTKGIQPDAVVGHSVGEVAAAYISGALSFEDAILVSYHRSRLQQTTAGMGGMLAVGLSEEEANGLLTEYQQVSVAAINSPSSVTLAGDNEELTQIAGLLEENGIFNRKLAVEVPYHSPIMELIKDGVLSSLAGLSPRATKIPLFSTVTGNLIDGTTLDASYWWLNVRQAVRFADAAKSIFEQGYKLLLEVGPHPVLKNSIKECMQSEGVTGESVATLIREKNEQQKIAECIAALYTLGAPVEWTKLHGEAGKLVDLPRYPWQKEHYWSETERSREERIGLDGHVYLNKNMRLSYPAWEVELNDNYFPFLADHQVEDTIVFPGAGYVEGALAMNNQLTESEKCTLEDITFFQVLVPEDNKVQRLHFAFKPETKKFEVYSRYVHDTPEWKLHASGKILPALSDSVAIKQNIQELKKRYRTEINVADFYETLLNLNLKYGAFFKPIRSIFVDKTGAQDSVWIQIEAHPSLQENKDRYILHPSILDAGFQSLIATMDSDGITTPYVPVSIEQMRIHAAIPTQLYCQGTINEKNESSIKGDLVFFDIDGNTLIEIKNLTCQALVQSKKKNEKSLDEKFYEFTWEPSKPVQENLTGQKKWIVFAENTPDSEQILASLAAQGSDVVSVYKNERFEQANHSVYHVNPESEQDIAQLFEQENNFTNVLYLWSWNTTNEKNTPEFAFARTLDTSVSVTNIAKALVSYTTPITFQIVTQYAQKVEENETIIDLSASVLWGLGFLIGNEQEHIFCKLIDLDHSSVSQLLTELLSDNQDDDVAYRNNNRYVKQVKKQPITVEKEVAVENISTDTPVRLVQEQVGSVESLTYKQFTRKPLSANEVEVKISAVPINFKDLLKVYNFIDAKVLEGTSTGTSFGMECSGTIVRVGKDVKMFKVGDAVGMGGVQNTFASYLTVPETSSIVRTPKNFTAHENTLFVPFFTAYYGLAKLAHLQKGEKILIHNATGGVGLAAVQLAQWIGAEIIATAGSARKREHLHNMGIEHVFNSRDLLFANQIKELTNGYGIDVVISAMSGDALAKSFELLAPYGRYIEIGKKDISDNSGLPMRTFNRNVSFMSLDIDRMFRERPRLPLDIWETEVFPLFETEIFKPLPLHIYPASEVKDAFKLMRDSKHIGRIVIDFENQTVPIEKQSKTKQGITQEASYLITGGTQGLGFELAKWLSVKQVKQIILLSRSGKIDESRIPELDKMQANGTQVSIHAVDVSNEQAMSDLFTKINTQYPPLRGILHGAMVLDDAFIGELDKERYEKVLTPKVKGALLLHKLTQNIPLDFFISFSSISSIIGNKGQANYVVANTFLDSFATWRKDMGMAATTINLGVLAETGVVSRNEKLTDFFQLSGVSSIRPDEVTEALEKIIENKPVQIGLFDVEWDKWSKMNKKSASSSRFAQLVFADTQTENLKQKEIIAKLLAVDTTQRTDLLEEEVCNVLGGVLKCSPESVDKDTSLKNMGIDSLMTVELQVALENSFGVEISNMELLKGPTVREIGKMMTDKLANSIELAEIENEKTLENISEQELDSLITKLIEK